MSSKIDFSAQFGDQESADLVLPHFRALKAAAKGRTIEDFPARTLAFILRVDGSITAFRVSGAHNVAFDRKKAYVSVDIGVTIDDRAQLRERLSSGIQASVEVLRASTDKRLLGTDFQAVAQALRDLCLDYEARVAKMGP
jgi:hypothetical protein